MFFYRSFHLKFRITTLLMLMLSALTTANEKAVGNLEYLDILYKQQKYKELIDNLAQFPKQEMRSEHYRYLIYSYAEFDLDGAEHAAQEAIEALPDDPDVYLMHASIMSTKSSNTVFDAADYAKKALQSLHKAVELAPNVMQYREALISFHLNAPSSVGGDTDTALQQITIIKSMDYVQAKINLAWYYRTVEDPAASLAVLTKAVTDFPDNISLINALAIHHVEKEDYAQAIDAYTQLTAINLLKPAQYEISLLEAFDESRFRQLNAHYQIGRLALLHNSRFEEGATHLQIYIDSLQNLDVMDTRGLPSMDWAYLRLSGILLALKQKARADDAFARVTLDANDENMQRVYSRLQKQFK